MEPSKLRGLKPRWKSGPQENQGTVIKRRWKVSARKAKIIDFDSSLLVLTWRLKKKCKTGTFSQSVNRDRARPHCLIYIT